MSIQAHIPDSVPERRSFLRNLFIAVGGLVSAALAIPLVRFATFPLRAKEEETSWSDVGKIDEFPRSTHLLHARLISKDRWLAQFAVAERRLRCARRERQSEGAFFRMPALWAALVRWVEKRTDSSVPAMAALLLASGVHVSGTAAPRDG